LLGDQGVNLSELDAEEGHILLIVGTIQGDFTFKGGDSDTQLPKFLKDDAFTSSEKRISAVGNARHTPIQSKEKTLVPWNGEVKTRFSLETTEEDEQTSSSSLPLQLPVLYIECQSN